MSTNSRFYTMWGVHLTEEDIDTIEENWDSDDPVDNIVEELEKLCKEYGTDYVPTQPAVDSACVIGEILFESDGWDEGVDNGVVALKWPRQEVFNGLMKVIEDVGIQNKKLNYYSFVQTMY